MMEFTFNAYKNLVETLKEHGYIFSSYLDYDKYDKSVIMRHDVDRDLEKALKFCEMEQTPY